MGKHIETSSDGVKKSKGRSKFKIEGLIIEYVLNIGSVTWALAEIFVGGSIKPKKAPICTTKAPHIEKKVPHKEKIVTKKVPRGGA